MARVLLTLIAILTLLFLLLPLIVIVSGSFTTDQVLRFPPSGLTTRWYSEILADPTWTSAILTSSQLAFVATLIATPLATLTALGIAASGSRFAVSMRELFMAPLVLPHVVLGAAMLQLSAATGLMQTFTALLIGHVVIIMPFVLQSLLPLLTKNLHVLTEASSDLGAGPWQTFRHVTLPIVRPGLITGSIFAFIFSWINVELSVFQTTSSLTTAPVKIFNYVQYQVDPLIAAVSSLTIFFAIATLLILELFFGLDILPKTTRKRS